MAYDFHPEAKRELENAVAYYDNINTELGDTLLNEVEQSLERIVKFPEAWSKLSKNTRRCRLVGFPYGIVYQVVNERVLVLAFMHLQQKPNYWMDRI
ncbi:plasmid stabilization protein [Scytonema hofmannii PCC 7110]|uniref:Plasmid stabilization protein n=1 Tax=Scytonema hofmannii PCC 7110 TaxID=128403 RepID=A0A139WWS1_9CYAN|nr:type II toxin-antitoxin system RelE/ParE family toxin [Scytonema hofmannii]KYC36884.1 plasmid stabilization protein [Scytonema hofmannii PCC 7110]